MSDEGREDRESILLAILIGVFSALAILLVVVLLVRSGGDDTEDATTAAPATTAAATSTEPPSTSATTTPPTTAAATTTVPPTTAAPTTTTTTTTVPFSGTTDWQGCTGSGSDAGMVSEIRFAQREGFTRIVFDFTGGVPACTVGYADPHTLAVIVHPIDISNPYAPGVFDGSGQVEVGTNSVNRVSAGGMGGGSGEWQFSIDLAGTRNFNVFTLESPSRLAIDIED